VSFFKVIDVKMMMLNNCNLIRSWSLGKCVLGGFALASGDLEEKHSRVTDIRLLRKAGSVSSFFVIIIIDQLFTTQHL
jgi:hypothetical protein